ncbi:MAG: metal-dependent hydrolase [candidate division NC10 bacterium]|nr:metal-dependent hydrolase [candidate division NC10 bacterium]
MVTLTYLGHSCFTMDNGKRSIIIDPFLTGNPEAATQADKVKVDAVLASHGHDDHLGDAVAIAKRLKVPVIAPYELACYCQRQGAEAHPMHIGGAYQFPFGWVKLTQALHGSAVVRESIEYTGHPCGFIIQMEGKHVYYAGDTGLFGDMALLGKLHSLDVALLPIGDNFTMGIADAVEATKMLNPAVVVPIHYGTFPVIKQDPQVFAREVSAKTSARCVILRPGEKLQVSTG